jgi:CheY-like chemotaxis protein
MKTILVVEGSAVVQALLREILESEGYKSLGATHVNKAYDLLVNHRHEIDLVLTEYNLPDISGLHFMARMRLMPEFKKIPVIFISDVTDKEIIKAVNEMPLTSWLPKPYRPSVLLSEIKNKMQDTSIR